MPARPRTGRGGARGRTLASSAFMSPFWGAAREWLCGQMAAVDRCQWEGSARCKTEGGAQRCFQTKIAKMCGRMRSSTPTILQRVSPHVRRDAMSEQPRSLRHANAPELQPNTGNSRPARRPSPVSGTDRVRCEGLDLNLDEAKSGDVQALTRLKTLCIAAYLLACQQQSSSRHQSKIAAKIAAIAAKTALTRHRKNDAGHHGNLCLMMRARC